MKKSQNLNDYLDNLIDGLDLPSNDQLKIDTRREILTRVNRDKALNPRFRENMRIKHLGKKRPDMVGDRNIAKTKKERERRRKLFLGKVKNKKQIEKFKKTFQTLDEMVCPHCNAKSKNYGNMNRYHFDNCKKNPNSPRYIANPKIVKTRKKQPKVTCPHCGYVGAKNYLSRHHFDNCKHKK